MFLKLGASYSLDGILSHEALDSHTKSFSSVLYLCPDTDGDCGVDGGTFMDVQSAFKGSARHVPVAVGKLASVSFAAGSQDENRRILHALTLYTSIRDAFVSLPTPTLITCKSNRRAGMAYAAFDFVENHLDEDIGQYLEARKTHGMMFMDTPAMRLWFETVVAAKRSGPRSQLVFRQLFEKTSSTYTYLLADNATKECVLIDPVKETAERDAKLIAELGLVCKLALNTHVHADHITGTGMLKTLLTPPPLSVISRDSTATADVLIDDLSSLSFGQGRITIFPLSTPGHTAGCMSFVIFDHGRTLVFTGDALLIRGCGRTDFQGGSSELLFDSVHSRLFTLPSETIVCPAHNYDGLPSSTISEERKFNPRLNQGKEKFVEIMAGLNLPRPAKMDDAVPANLVCGI